MDSTTNESDAKSKPETQVAEDGTTKYLDDVTGEYISKNELKKRKKLRDNEAKKKEKEDKKKKDEEDKAGDAEDNKGPTIGEEELDPSKYTENRKNWLMERRGQGENPYPHKFHRTHRIDQFVKEFDPL